MIGTFGALTEPPHTLDQLLCLFGRRQFLLWLSSTFLVALAVLLATLLLTRLHPRSTPRMRLLRGMAYGCISGILSAHSLLVAKSAVELLVRTVVDHHNQFNRWQSWIILLGLMFLALSQLYYLHRGLKLCSTSVLYPFVFCIYNIIAILDGLIYFRQTSRLPVLDAMLIAVGTVVLLSGVLALSWRLGDRDGEPATKAHRRVSVSLAASQTALTPGMGLVGSDSEDDDTFSTASGRLHGGDDECGVVNHTRGTSPTNERTPLLRTSTLLEAGVPRSKRRSPSRPTKRRRMALSEEAAVIWDELNDQDGHRRPSVGSSPRSSNRASSEGNVSVKHENNGAHEALRRASVNSVAGEQQGQSLEQCGRRPRRSDEEFDGEETEDSLCQVGPDDRRSWSQHDARWRKGSTASREALAGWLPLRWWTRRRRDGDDGSEDDRAGTRPS